MLVHSGRMVIPGHGSIKTKLKGPGCERPHVLNRKIMASGQEFTIVRRQKKLYHLVPLIT